jgi:putative thiamine transport system permease protein
MTLIPALLLLDLTVLGLPPWALALWGHVMFTAAYAYLSLRGPVLSLDPRYRQAALALGRPPWQALLLVELPVLLRPLMVSLAIALSVSVAAYLPTLTLGQGRIETFTVEAVAAATGGSRRTAAQFALSQSFWALLFFFSALAVPNLAFRNRRGLAAHVT